MAAARKVLILNSTQAAVSREEIKTEEVKTEVRAESQLFLQAGESEVNNLPVFVCANPPKQDQYGEWIQESMTHSDEVAEALENEGQFCYIFPGNPNQMNGPYTEKPGAGLAKIAEGLRDKGHATLPLPTKDIPKMKNKASPPSEAVQAMQDIYRASGYGLKMAYAVRPYKPGCDLALISLGLEEKLSQGLQEQAKYENRPLLILRENELSFYSCQQNERGGMIWKERPLGKSENVGDYGFSQEQVKQAKQAKQGEPKPEVAILYKDLNDASKALLQKQHALSDPLFSKPLQLQSRTKPGEIKEVELSLFGGVVLNRDQGLAEYYREQVELHDQYMHADAATKSQLEAQIDERFIKAYKEGGDNKALSIEKRDDWYLSSEEIKENKRQEKEKTLKDLITSIHQIVMNTTFWQQQVSRLGTKAMPDGVFLLRQAFAENGANDIDFGKIRNILYSQFKKNSWGRSKATQTFYNIITTEIGSQGTMTQQSAHVKAKELTQWIKDNALNRVKESSSANERNNSKREEEQKGEQNDQEEIQKDLLKAIREKVRDKRWSKAVHSFGGTKVPHPTENRMIRVPDGIAEIIKQLESHDANNSDPSTTLSAIKAIADKRLGIKHSRDSVTDRFYKLLKGVTEGSTDAEQTKNIRLVDLDKIGKKRYKDAKKGGTGLFSNLSSGPVEPAERRLKVPSSSHTTVNRGQKHKKK